jgi:hypothetical protein
MTIHGPNGEVATLKSARPDGFLHEHIDKARDFEFSVEYEAFKGWVNNMSPDLAHVLFTAPICSEHEVPVDQCGCP